MFGNNGDDGNGDSNENSDDDVEYVIYDYNDRELVRYDTREKADIGFWNNQAAAYVEEEPVEPAGTTCADLPARGTNLDDVYPDLESLYPAEEPSSTSPYGFFSERDSESYDVRKWSLGSHSTVTNLSGDALNSIIGDLDDEVDGDLKGVLEEAAGMVSAATVSGFECPVCGLNHGHPDDKHDIRDAFDVAADFADEMQYNPYCHCGVNELAMLLDFYDEIEAPVFTDEPFFSSKDFDRRVEQINSASDSAPVPDHVRNNIADTREEIERALDR